MEEKIADLPRKSHTINRSPGNKGTGNFGKVPTSHPINVVIGDLLGQHDLDVIVSFLTDDLSWGGPINQQLIGEVGHLLDDYVLLNVIKPTIGTVFSTPPFALPCKALIFGVIPKWDAGLSGEDRQFKNMVKDILQLTKKLGYSSLGLPAVGLSRNDMPIGRGARAMINAINDTDTSPFNEIRVLCKNQAVFDVYKERLKPE